MNALSVFSPAFRGASSGYGLEAPLDPRFPTGGPLIQVGRGSQLTYLLRNQSNRRFSLLYKRMYPLGLNVNEQFHHNILLDGMTYWRTPYHNTCTLRMSQ